MVKEFSYVPKGTCSKMMKFKIDENNTILDFEVVGGCPGNLQGIKRLIIGMNAKEVSDKLKGVLCGFKSTSCPDQLANALAEYLQNENERSK